MTIQPPEANRFLKMLVYGSSGSGKTVLAATAQDDPRTSPTLILDMEGGTDSLVGKDIAVARIRSWSDYNAAFKEAQEGAFRCVVVDSLSETQVFALDDILQRESGNRRDKELLTQQDFGKGLLVMRRFVRHWFNLPVHTIFTALAKETLDPREGVVIVPKFAGQFTEDASAIMSVVAYLALSTDAQTNAVERVLLLKNQSRFRVKARTPVGSNVPDTITAPTVSRILDALQFPAPDGAPAMSEPVSPGKHR